MRSLSVLTLFAIFFSNGWADESVTGQQALRAYSLMKKIIDSTPDTTLKRGLKTYLEIIGLDQGDYSKGLVGGNTGVVNSLENTFTDKNPCTQALFFSFYTDVERLDLERDKQYGRTPQTNDPEFEFHTKRPTQGVIAGKGKEKEKPGWLWDLAMQHTGGNPSLAMSLIASCGHDDMTQGFAGNITIRPDSKESLYLQDTILQRKKNIAFELENISTWQSPGKTNRTYGSTPENVLRQQEKSLHSTPASQILFCPKNGSIIHVSKNLGARVDISDSLRQRLIAVSGGGKPEKVPSKNYHIVAAAYMGCKLREAGLSEFMIKKMEQLSAWSYRTIRMNDLIGERNRTYDKAASAYEKQKNQKPGLSLDDFIRNTAEFSGDTPESLYATHLFSQWNISGETVGGIKLPYIDSNLRSPLNWLEEQFSSIEKFTKPDGWSDESFRRAKKITESYLLDWEWTVEQHGVGATFGAQQCTPQPEGADPEKQACRAIDKILGLVPPQLDKYFNPELQCR